MTAIILPPSLRLSLDDTKVSYKQLGKSGLRVSVPILGCMSFGDSIFQPWINSNEAEIDKLLKDAYDCGLNTWDTANVYSNGASERLIGAAIKRHNIPRQKLVLLSKCWGVVGEEPDIVQLRHGRDMEMSKDYVNQGGLGRTAIFNSVNASLERLGTPYLDLLQIHRFDYTVQIEETMKALHDLVESGKVRYIGASSMWAYQFAAMQYCAEVHGWTKFISMQNHYSLCYREEEREMNPLCHSMDVGLIAWAPLCRGLLARPPGSARTTREETMRLHPQFEELSESDIVIISRVQEIAKKRGWEMSQVALAWVISKGSIPVVGLNSSNRLMSAVGIRGKSLTSDEVKYIEAPYRPKEVEGHF
ncbi:alcohol dehydrogenase [Trichoderma arundinaceum]|uniref:Alcohol dehydrogenase n=1 Tax=Trichoderma arundinaceum TaxID=490622 RepID=A0A395NF44_TRIAR|nr:alcohol dehydrogenase [Trichoderma arundinaceum]